MQRVSAFIFGAKPKPFQHSASAANPKISGGLVMKNVLLAGAAFYMLVAASAEAAPSTPIIYDGAGFVTAATSGCPASLGFVPGLTFSSHYRPYLASGDSPDGWLMEYVAGASLIMPNAGNTLKGSQAFTTTGLSDRAVLYSNQSNGAGKLTITPATITASTLTVTISGTLQNLYGLPGCTLTVRAAMTQRP